MKTDTRKIVYSALFAALIAVSIYIFHIPAGKGIIHLGDAIIYLGAVMLPFPYGIASAAVGGALADLVSGYAVYIIPTFIIKAINAMCFYAAKSGGTKIITKRSIAAAVVSSIVTVVGYYLFAALYYHGWKSQLIITVPGNLVQAGGSFAAFLAIGLVFDKAGVAKKIKL
ncbi:MAG: TIGR04002 family protein [Oscillospiraceae bacterium]|jgi:uncharacterized repeat protein (TIGR04002 family)